MRHLPACLCILAVLLLCCLPLPIRAGEALSVTLLLEHAPDSDWNRLLRQGLERAAQEFALETRFVQIAENEDALAVFRTVAKDAALRATGQTGGQVTGTGLVLVASHRLHEILRDNAGNFRKVRFGCVDAGIRAPNIMCVTFADEQGAYLAGVAASMRAASRKGTKGGAEQRAVGWLSGEDVPAMRSLFNGFAEGVKLTSPSMRVIHGVAGSFVDTDKARNEAKRLIAEGVSVLALASGPGNAAALEEAKAAGIDIIGLDVDQARLWPGHVLTSIVKKADQAVYSIVAATARGDFRGKEIVTYDLSGGVAVTAPADREIRRRMDEVEREIATGGIRIRSLRERTLCDCQ